MTEKEAIRILGDTQLCSPLGQAAFRAIECIKELQQYREIGTVEEFREAVEKQKPKKPLGGVDINGNEYKICRECGCKLTGTRRADT